MHPIRTLPALVTLLLLLAACGGTTAPSTEGAATDGGGNEPAATSTSDGGSTGGNTDWCLNTVDEVSAALEIEVAEAAGNDAPGVGGGCLYNAADGSLAYGISVVTADGASGAFQAAKGGDGVETIGGIGDDAVLVSPGGPLAVLKGDAFISIGAVPPVPIIDDAAAYRAALEELGRAAVGRLP